MKSKASWYVVGIAAICVIGTTLMMFGRREVKAGGAKMSREFPLSVDDSVYDGEGFFEDYCACYSDYDEIRSMTVSLQGKWQSGRIYLTLVDDEGKCSGRGNISSSRKFPSRTPAMHRRKAYNCATALKRVPSVTGRSPLRNRYSHTKNGSNRNVSHNIRL